MLGKLPAYLCTLLCLCSGNYQLRSSKCLLFNIPRVCTELGKTAFSYYAPWDTFQKDLKLDKFVSVGESKGIIREWYWKLVIVFVERICLNIVVMCTCCI